MDRINLDSNKWGPHGWFFLDSIILSYQKNPDISIKNEYISFFNILKDILPCDKCRLHYSKYINENPLNDNILNDKVNFIKWILECHNNVNRINNKKEITYDEYINYYNNQYKMNILENTCSEKCSIEHFDNKEKKTSNLLLILIIIIIIVSFFFYFIFNYCKKK